MTNSPTIHPPQTELIAFGLGKLQPDESQRVEEHLEACPDCCATVHNLQDDTFVNLVREAGKLTPIGAQADATLDVGARTSIRTDAIPTLPAELRDHARYEIQGLLGRGGMGDVYKAQHKVMHRPVALKVIKPELVQNEMAVQRFRREVQAAARLHDRNIVTAYDAEQAGNLHFLVMEFVDGVNLDEVVRRRGALPVEQACDYIRQAAAGLQHAHELGMVHRDIKPHNLMLTYSGEVKILDFGLASFVSDLAADEVIESSTASASKSSVPGHTLEQLTQMGTMMGTPDYIAPEQAQDSHAADIRADIYSLGCTFYTLLAGRAPFSAGTVLDKIRAHAEQVPPPLADFRADVPADVALILQKMLAKDPADRYQTPAEVTAALERWIESIVDRKLREGFGGFDGGIPIGKSLVRGDESPRRRHWIRIAIVFALLLIAGLGLTYWPMLWGFRTSEIIVNVPSRGVDARLYDDRGTLVGGQGPSGSPGFIRHSGLPTGTYWLKAYEEDDENKVLLWRRILVGPGHVQAVDVAERVRGTPPRAPVNLAVTKLAANEMAIEVCNRSQHVVYAVEADTRIYDSNYSRRYWPFQLNLGPEGLKPDECRTLTFSRHAEIPPFVNSLALDVVEVGFGDGEKWRFDSAAENPSVQRSQSNSEFFQILGDLQAIVRKTMDDEGLTLRDASTPSDAKIIGPRRELYLKAEVAGEQGRQGKIFSALTDKFKALAQASNAFVGSLELSRQGDIDRYRMTYTTPKREGTIQLERSLVGADKRMPAIWTWSLTVRVEEWPKAEIMGLIGTDVAMESDWTPLFNGRDLTGWKMQPNKPGNWRVENGVLIGGKLDDGPEEENSFLATEKSDFTNFHLKLEAKLNPGAADTGVLFDFADGNWAEANIAFNPSKRDQYVGSIMVAGTKLNGVTWQAAPRDLASPNEWFTLEVIAVGRQITTRVNGKVAVVHTQRKKTTGPIRLQDHGPFTVAEFRKIEITELNENGKPLLQPPAPEAAPLTIGMNDEFGMLIEGRLVAPAELSRRLRDALKENPDRVVAVDLPKRPWTVAAHVDQLEQIARIAGAKRITRPAWSEIRIVFGVQNHGAQTLDIKAPGHSASGFLKSYLPNVREVIAKNPNLPVLLDIAEGVTLADAQIAEGFAEVRRVAEAAGAEVRLGRKLSEADDSAKLIATLPGHTGAIVDLAWSRDGKWIASVSSDHIVHVWDADTHKIVATFPHREPVAAVAFSPDSRWLVRGTVDAEITIHELVDKPGATTTLSSNDLLRLHDLAFSPDGDYILCCGAGADDKRTFALLQNDGKRGVRLTKSIQYEDTAPLRKLAVWPGVPGFVTAVSERGEAVTWNHLKGKAREQDDHAPAKLDYKTGVAIGLLGDGHQQIVGNAAGELWFRDDRGTEKERRIELPMAVYCLAVVPGGKYVIVGGSERGGQAGIATTASALALVEIATGKFSFLPEAKEHKGVIRAIEISPDGRRLVTSAGWQYSPGRWLQTNDYAIRMWRLPENVSSNAEEVERADIERKDDPAIAILGDWTESNDPQRGPVHTLKFLKNGEFHEAGPMAISLGDGPNQWVTKDLDGDGKPDIVPFQMSGSWELKAGELHTETTSSNVLGFKNERPGNQRRFKIETLTKDKLVLVLLEDGKETERFIAFRPNAAR